MARVLVVDDRADSRELLLTLLHHAGHETLEAGDGSEALRLIRVTQPDLVITEILMPGIDGFEFVRRLRAENEIDQPRVIFCTAANLADQAKEMARACGTSGIIEKPSDPEKILAIITQGLEGKPDGAALPDDETFDRAHLRLVNQKLLEKVAELERVNLERQKLLVGLVHAQENERSRIAVDLHDDPIQLIAAISLHLRLLGAEVSDPEHRDALREIADTAALAVARLRRLIFDLSPRNLEIRGLGGAIEDYLYEVAEEAGFSWSVEDSLPEELPGDVTVILYRIAQEAIRNAQKHAQARTVKVTLNPTDGGTTLCVADDGVGFKPDERTMYRPGHLGLASIRERATAAGGRFELNSAPGAGCVVEVWVPHSFAAQ